MKFNKVTQWGPSVERRRFGRIHLFEPRRCHIHLPESQRLWTDQGILVNISLGGIYFVCDRQPPLEKDDICYLTFESPDADPQAHHLGLHVSVVRTEEVQLHLSQFAMALKIISPPIYNQSYKSKIKESTSIDKLDILFRYYDLNKKVYELIANTSEIRTDKIDNIKEIIDKGGYKVKSNKVTEMLINDYFIQNIVRSKK
jgi:anti-sigma28 factor (negative regulator of flagellin synthesis)